MPDFLVSSWSMRRECVTNMMNSIAVEEPVSSRENPSGFRSTRRAQRGITLVEVLVTLVVLSIGLLGIAMLQMNSLNANHSAYMRSQAVNLAYDMTDRMRANRQAALDGDYDHALGATPPSGQTVAVQDINAWLTELGAVLPEATGGIQRVDDQVTVSVRWQDTRAGAEACEPVEEVEETGEETGGETELCVDDFMEFRVVTRL